MASKNSLTTSLIVRGQTVALQLLRHPNASQYILRFANGTGHITVPKSGSFAGGVNFAKEHQDWLLQQVLRKPKGWGIGTEFLFRGEVAVIESIQLNGASAIQFKTEQIPLPSADANIRGLVEQRLRQLAEKEFPLRVKVLGLQHDITSGLVVVKDQRSRWGSSSSNGTISLNWRLIQTPLFVINYVICHELAHQREMNHSDRFWAVVASICPDYQAAEQWLRGHPSLLY